SRLLADAGASVVAVEPRTGDPLRRRGATPASFDADGDGLLFRYLRAGQHAVALELEEAADRAALRRLYRDCDGVLDAQPVGRLDALALGERALAQCNPRAVWLSLSCFGAGNAWSQRPANDFTLQA